MIGDSYQPSATLHNSENIGLEPVWPYGVIGDSTTVNGDNLTALADRTYNSRPNTDSNDWSYDAVDAARLDMGSQVSSDLVTNTEKYQTYISGLASVQPRSSDEPYIEQASNVATAMDEALATDYDGTLRIAPAWPSGWDAAGTVYIQGGSKVDVQIEGGVIATAAIQAGTTETMTVRNPWSGQQAEVVNGSTGAVVVAATTSATLSVPVTAGSSYLIEQPSAPTTSLAFAQVTGTQATAAKHLGGKVQIGLDAAAGYASLAASFNDVGITADSNTAPGNYDGGGASFSETALTNAGAAPGATVVSSGIAFTFPNVAAGSNDNTVAEGQTITMSGSGTLGFLVSGSYGPASGTGTITYTDGSTQSYTLNAPDWFSTSPPSGGAVAVSSAYQNRQGNTTYAGTGDIFSETVALTAGKTDRLGHPAAGRGADHRHPGRARLRDQRGGAVRRHRGGGAGHGAGGQLRHRRAGHRLQRRLGQRQRQQLPARRGRPRGLQRHRLRRRHRLDRDRAVVPLHRQRRHRPHLHGHPAAGLPQRRDRRAAHRQLLRRQPVRVGQRPEHRRLADLGHGDGQRHPSGRPADADHLPGQRGLEHPRPDVLVAPRHAACRLPAQSAPTGGTTALARLGTVVMMGRAG